MLTSPSSKKGAEGFLGHKFISDKRRTFMNSAAGHSWMRMLRRKFQGFLLLAFLLLIVAGCAYPISQQYRKEVRPDLTFSMVLQNPDAYIGSIVIWGGSIIETRNSPGETEIIVLETPLGYEERPKAPEFSRGRFIVKTMTFLDPAIYRPERWITVAGEVVGKETRPLGKAQYTYPVLKAKEIHLWRREVVYVYPPDYYWGWDWYGPYWYGNPYWYGSPYWWPDDYWD
jgi:outer membrane lipoprotein